VDNAHALKASFTTLSALKDAFTACARRGPVDNWLSRAGVPVNLVALIDPTGPVTRRKGSPMSVRRIAVVLSTVVAGLGLAAGAATAEPSAFQRCERGEFCMWTDEFFLGAPHNVSQADTNFGECVQLPLDVDVRSFINRTDRPVTVYQGRDCSTEGDFTTYPGEGTYVPQAPFVVRALQVWEH